MTNEFDKTADPQAADPDEDADVATGADSTADEAQEPAEGPEEETE